MTQLTTTEMTGLLSEFKEKRKAAIQSAEATFDCQVATVQENFQQSLSFIVGDIITIPDYPHEGKKMEITEAGIVGNQGRHNIVVVGYVGVVLRGDGSYSVYTITVEESDLS